MTDSTPPAGSSDASIGRWRMLPPARDPVVPRHLWTAALDGLALDAAALSSTLEEICSELWTSVGAPEGSAESSVLLTGSGTGALDLALRVAAGGRPLRSRKTSGSGRPRVALPAWGCYALASAAVGADAEVLYYDLDPRTLTAEPSSVERVLEEGAEAVVLVHYYGYPGFRTETLDLVRSAGAVVVEDAAQRSGGALGGSPLGAFGDLTVLSFGRGKGLTCGGGGALLLRDPGLASRFRREAEPLRDGGGERRRGWGPVVKTAAQWALGRPSLYRLPASIPFLGLGETHYVPPTAPKPLAAVPARLLRRALGSSTSDEASRRTANARELESRLRDSAARVVRPTSGGAAGFLRLPLLLPASDASTAGSGEPPAPAGFPRLGIIPGYPRLLSELGVLEEVPLRTPLPVPGAESIRARLVTLPTHGLLAERDLAAVARWVHRTAGGVDGRGPPRAPDRNVERMER